MNAVSEPRQGGRWARLIERRRQRRRLAAALAAAGLAVLALALAWDPGSGSAPAGTAGTGGSGVVDPVGADKPPSTGPGGVGKAPEKTGLPAVPTPGGKVRTGSADQGCFSDIRAYLDQWHRTGVEPDPCFTAQSPSEQDQPDDVVRSYNGERF